MFQTNMEGFEIGLLKTTKLEFAAKLFSPLRRRRRKRRRRKK